MVAPSRSSQVLEEARTAREEVATALEAVRLALAGPPHRVAAPLVRLADVVRRHAIQAEGPGGLFDQVLEMAPRLQSVIEGLRRDHARLPRDLLALAGAAAGGGEELEAEVDAACSRLAEHRRRADHMLLEAFDVDIGGG